MCFYSSAFVKSYSNNSAALPWMFISDHDSFSVEEAIAATEFKALTATPTRTMTTSTETSSLSLSESPQPGPEPPIPLTSPIVANSGASDTASAAAATGDNKNLPVLILAPILSVLGLAVVFIVLWRCVYARRRAKRVAPSAEFKQYQRTSIPLADVEVGPGGPVRGMRSIDNQQPASYAYPQSGSEEAEGDAPPAFTPGLFKDPIFEKGVAMSLANQSGVNLSGPWAGHHGHGHGHASNAGTGTGMGATTGVDVRTQRGDSLPLPGGDSDSPASLSMLAHSGQGQHSERQQLIPPEERY